jgi:molybdopterin-guanine dinucleotide biosynthesis protein A
LSEPNPTALGVVLAGGRSSRLGQPKPTAELGGRALIDYSLAALREAGLEVVVVAKPATELPALSAPAWLEPEEPSHPLLGIVTALERSRDRPVLVCGCDLPFVTPALALHLASLDAPLVVPRAGGRLHPLLARYDPSLVDALSVALAERRSLHHAIAQLDAVIVDEQELGRFGDPARLLFNVNTPADLALAEEMSRGGEG